jgi:hypothetical protein
LLAFGPQLGLRPDDHVLVVSTEGDTDPGSYRRIVDEPTRRAFLLRSQLPLP